MVTDDVDMEQKLTTLYNILSAVLLKELEGNLASFDSIVAHVNVLNNTVDYFLPILAENGFLNVVPDHPDLAGRTGYRLTWKGFQFVLLYECQNKYPMDNSSKVVVEIDILRLLAPPCPCIAP